MTLEEALKGKDVACLREVLRTLFGIPHAKDMTRDALRIVAAALRRRKSNRRWHLGSQGTVLV